MRKSLVLVLLVCLAPGCEPDPPPPPTGITSATSSANAAPAPKDSSSKNPRARTRRRPRGTAGLLKKALRDLELDDTQRAALQAVIKARTDDPGTRAARKDLDSALAAGARAGKLDDVVIAKKRDALIAAMTRKRKIMTDAIDELHKALTPKQRLELVTTFGEGDTGSWFDDGSDTAIAPRTGSKAHMIRMARGLDLTEEQRKTMRAAMKAEPKPSEEERDKLIKEVGEKRQRLREAFASKTFDAASMDLTQATSDWLTKGVDRQIKAVTTLLTIVDEDQREQLARNLGTKSKRPRPMRRMGH